MKTKEFIKKVEDLGFEIDNHNSYLMVKNKGKDNIWVADISKFRECEINTLSYKLDYADKSTKHQLFKLIAEYASTPVAEREEEKKYYLKHKWMVHGGAIFNYSYLNYNSKDECYFVNGEEEFEEFKTRFTQKEIEEIKEKFNTTLEDFEIIEVEE